MPLGCLLKLTSIEDCMSASAFLNTGRIMMFSSDRRWVKTFACCFRIAAWLRMTDDSFYGVTQCDTFSRSSTAVFELSTRFGDLFKYEEGADEATKESARKLLFLELTQGELDYLNMMEYKSVMKADPLSLLCSAPQSAYGVTPPTCHSSST